MRKLLATDFSIWPMAVATQPTISDAVFYSQDHWESLANYLLLYDQLIIPTGNFQIIPALRMMLGEDIFDELVLSNVISFVRYDHWICYGGNGKGLAFFQVAEGKNENKNNVQRLGLGFFKKKDEAISIMLNVSNPDYTKKGKKFISNLLLDQTIDLNFGKISDDLKNDTYSDILGSKYLRNLFSRRRNIVDLNRLPGVDDNQIKMLGLHLPEDNDKKSSEITFLLKVAVENFILGIGSFVEATDIVSDSDTLNVIKAKGQRFGCPIGGRDAFSKIQDISGVPDIGLAFAKKQLSPRTLLDLRETPASQNFRNWLSQIDRRSSSKEIVERYVDSIGGASKKDQFSSKLMRFATMKVWETIEPVSGNVASIVETFLLNKLYPNKCPDLFLKKAKSIIAKPAIAPPIPKRQGRKAPCPCGSGKKYKRCCGKNK